MLEEENCTEYIEMQKHLTRLKKEDAEGVNTCETEERLLIVMMKEGPIENTCEEQDQLSQVNIVKTRSNYAEKAHHTVVVTAGRVYRRLMTQML